MPKSATAPDGFHWTLAKIYGFRPAPTLYSVSEAFKGFRKVALGVQFGCGCGDSFPQKRGANYR